MSGRLLKNKSVRSITLVAAGTAGAQLINVAFTPIVTRVYGPEAFGLLGTFLAILAVVTPLAALSYPIAIVLPKENKEASTLAGASVVIALVTSLLAALLLFFAKPQIVDLFDLQAVEPYLFLLPLSMFFAALVAVANNWIIRCKLFRVSARVAVIQSLLANLTKIGVGMFSPVAASLICVATAATFLHSVMLWFGIHRHSRGESGEESAPAGARELLARHYDFPLFRTPQIVINSIGQSLPVLMIASLFGPAAAGLYALPKSVLGMPSLLIGKSVADVFYPQFAEQVREGKNAQRILFKACSSLVAIGILVYAPVLAFGPWLFSFVFGESWYAAGEYAQWMSLWFIAILASRPVVAAIPVLSLQGTFLIFELVTLGLRAMAIYAGYSIANTALGAVAAFSLVSVVTFAALGILVLRRAAHLDVLVDRENSGGVA